MIREANTKDISAILGLWQEMMDFHIKRSDLYKIKPNAQQIYAYYLKEVLKNHESRLIVYEIQNKIVGYLMAEESLNPPVYKETRIGLIVEIGVTKNYRNKGIGEELISEIEKWFLNKDITRIECVISDFNEISKGFWFKNGYNPYNLMCVKKL